MMIASDDDGGWLSMLSVKNSKTREREGEKERKRTLSLVSCVLSYIV
jgi:hypothetical protein